MIINKQLLCLYDIRQVTPMTIWYSTNTCFEWVYDIYQVPDIAIGYASWTALTIGYSSSNCFDNIIFIKYMLCQYDIHQVTAMTIG